MEKKNDGIEKEIEQSKGDNLIMIIYDIGDKHDFTKTQNHSC